MGPRPGKNCLDVEVVNGGSKKTVRTANKLLYGRCLQDSLIAFPYKYTLRDARAANTSARAMRLCRTGRAAPCRIRNSERSEVSTRTPELIVWLQFTVFASLLNLRPSSRSSLPASLSSWEMSNMDLYSLKLDTSYTVPRTHKREEGMQLRNIKVQIGRGSYQK